MMCVSVNKLVNVYNPLLNPWPGIEEISLLEIEEKLNSGIFLKPNDYNPFKPESKESHINRIVWYIKYGWEDDPIHVVFNKNNLCPIYDGIHRMCAAIYKKDEFIFANVEGSIDSIKSISY